MWRSLKRASSSATCQYIVSVNVVYRHLTHSETFVLVFNSDNVSTNLVFYCECRWVSHFLTLSVYIPWIYISVTRVIQRLLKPNRKKDSFSARLSQNFTAVCLTSLVSLALHFHNRSGSRSRWVSGLWRDDCICRINNLVLYVTVSENNANNKYSTDK